MLILLLVGLAGSVSSQLPSQCGTKTSGGRQPRILNGEDARKGSWPWQGLLLSEGTPFCGAVLIAENWALTSALCVSGIRPQVVRFGEHDVTKEHGDEKEIGVKDVFPYPDFQGRIAENDLGLIKLNSSLEFSNLIFPICLPQEGVNITGQTTLSTGWGTSSHSGRQKGVLQQIVQEVLSSQECEEIYTKIGHDLSLPDEGFICTLDRVGDGKSCFGDGGGPVMLEREDGKWEVVGIQSWGIGCGKKDQPNVATRVEPFLEWIEEKLLN